MHLKGIIIFIVLFGNIFAQDSDERTLFTIDNESVTVKEFVRVYTKNNINNQADFSKESLEEYLELYKRFRLKVKEAEFLKMDEKVSFKNELASYRAQLTEAYMSDREVSEKLMSQAYQRMKEEINASHILIFWPSDNPSKSDSAEVLMEIKKIRESAIAGTFEDQMKIYNNKNGSKYSGDKNKYESGKLGFITVFQTIYPFESVMYNTKVGEISEPVATRFGYHLIKVNDKRKARGKMEVAHLMVKSKNSDGQENREKAKEKVFEIYKDIESKKLTFENAVQEFSEDKNTKYQKGKLKMMNSSQMLESFANRAFSIMKDGEIGAPVKTPLGWHIIKRLKKEEIPSFDFAKKDLLKKIEKDSRSKVAKEKMIIDTKNKFGYSENSSNYNEVFDVLVEAYAQGNFKMPESSLYPKPIFTIGKENVKQGDFIDFLKISRIKNKRGAAANLQAKYHIFKKDKITEYREKHLEEIDEDFKNLMQEYHDGILLFELTNEEVWNKAILDTTGLKSFFKANKKDYQWKERVEYSNYKCEDVKTSKCVKKYLEKGKSQEMILSKVNKKSEKLSVEEGVEEKGSITFIDKMDKTKGSITEEKNLDGSVNVFFVENILPPGQKELKETRGYVISDYQTKLENDWIQSLNEKFPIKLNQEVFESLIK